MDMARITIIFILFLAVFAFTACKEDTPVSPQGTWERTIGNGGTFEGVLEINNGVFNFTPKNQPAGHSDTKGRYSLTGNEITFEGDSCVNPGTYSYEVSRTEITFAIVNDNCEQRIKALNGTWKSKN